MCVPKVPYPAGSYMLVRMLACRRRSETGSKLVVACSIPMIKRRASEVFGGLEDVHDAPDPP
jgi:hypothetical protein